MSTHYTGRAKDRPSVGQHGGNARAVQNSRRRFLQTVPVLAAGAAACSRAGAAPPNIVLVITDDQGYGDLGCHGNPVVQTPHIDRFHGESVRFTDFHADPLCAPTRAGLLTGRYAYRTGVTAAYAGRSILRRDETTMAEILSAGGYRTGLFGKWHLGDNWPYRPNERGFDETVACWSGGVTQAADWWGNDYFDDTYYRNNVPEQFTGYCTDVFFDEGLRFIEQNRNQPFFLFLPTNAPHAPYWVDEKYSRPYIEQGIEEPRASFYGMITNIDDNFARLREKLRELGLEDNTILIFMTDNGSSAGWREGYNAGMRAGKGSNYDGGQRVPFFLRWPDGEMTGGRDVGRLATNIDVLPTFIELTGVPRPNVQFDGISLAPLLSGEGGFPDDRTHFIQHQQVQRDGKPQMENPQPFFHSAVLTERWRLVNGKDLYDIEADPGQENDVAAAHPDVVARLRAEYEKWWADVSPRLEEYVEIPVGAEEANPARLTSFDWYTGGPPNQQAIRDAPWEGIWQNGFWAIEVVRGGRYQIELRQQPREADFPIDGQVAKIEIGNQSMEQPIPEGAAAVTFDITLEPGKTTMQTWFRDVERGSRGAYYAYFNYVG